MPMLCCVDECMGVVLEGWRVGSGRAEAIWLVSVR